MTPKKSYSQSGEDLIIDFIFDTLQIKTRRYLDVGANDPTALSNTFFFYAQGHTGVCVEPDPDLCKKFSLERPKDKVLQVGIGKEKGKLPFYLMEPHTLNTFSKKEAEAYRKFYPWTSIREVTKIKLVSINDIFKKYFKKGLDILSVDTEGLDTEIIKSIEFEKYRPLVICVESAVYKGEKSLEKNDELLTYLRSKGYFIYADTFVNTIFVDYESWLRHNGAKLKGF